MDKNIRRIFVEKKPEYAVEELRLFTDLKENLKLKGLKKIRVVNRYDISGITEDEYQKARSTVFSEPPVDFVYDEIFDAGEDARVFAIEYLPGQYDQRADSAAQCVQLLTQKERPTVKTAKLIALYGDLNEEEFQKIKSYCINPLEAREAHLEKPLKLENEQITPEEVEILHGFISKNDAELEEVMNHLGLAMNFEDLKFCQEYFRNQENRNPTMTEVKVIDTYWSDHCRHTTFLTGIQDVRIQSGVYSEPIIKSFDLYKSTREYVYGNEERDMSLMDIAVIAMKELRKKGQLEDLEVSDEINACSIIVDVDIDGQNQEWLVMFKNETHNHPTEIEPFGGAATCLGGAIRDPLSGRSYVFGAMRVTGSGDPRTSIEDTLPGKLPQRKITTGAAAGYSSYGNQIGLATGQVSEIYDEGFIAKRMEIGAVVGAAPRENVKREKSDDGDIIILLGGRTGRDGCGGATGSSKEHDEESLTSCGAEVQKGNPPTERKIQRLFRNSSVSKMIKKCNDFGAGGVSVAIGELAPGLEIDLDAVPKKYEGLDGTELAISESQERMAVVIAPEDAEEFYRYAKEENLEATEVARVTSDNRLKMNWKGKTIVDVSRDFLDTNGVKQSTWVKVEAPQEDSNLEAIPESVKPVFKDLKKSWLANLQELNVCSQKGLVERFDSTIGASTVLMPFGGKYQETPSEGLMMKLPVHGGDTSTGIAMTYGYNPGLSKWSPFHGAFYAVIEAVSKVVALGGDYRRIRLTLQEYFEKLGKDPLKWGKPFSALLGAFYAQNLLGIAAIGGKDSMSGTFKELNVPPTLVAFAVDVLDVNNAVSQEFKEAGSKVVLLETKRGADGLPDMEQLMNNFRVVNELAAKGRILSSNIVKFGGVAAAISKMSFGNRIGFRFEEYFNQKNLFTPDYGSIIIEIKEAQELEKLLAGAQYRLLGETQEKQAILINGYSIEIEEALNAWKTPLEKVFPTDTHYSKEKRMLNGVENELFEGRNARRPQVKIARPRVFIPVFPGTNCEGDTARAFQNAGGAVQELVFRNLSAADIEQSIDSMVKIIDSSQIIAIPGGFSGGDEPDGSAKFIVAVFRNPRVKEAVTRLLKQRDGLMLGICNGFQALIKLGLLPHGEITEINDQSPTLTYNEIGRHVSCMAKTKIVSTLSPWFSKVKAGDMQTIAMSHGEGRFIGQPDMLEALYKNGQVATQYVDFEGKPSMDIEHNPNGSILAIEGITSPDGRILGKMGHSERIGANVALNIPGEKNQRIFEAGIEYFG